MKHDRMWYILRINKVLAEIKETPADEPQRFLILKKKAKKYLNHAKRLSKTSGNDIVSSS